MPTRSIVLCCACVAASGAALADDDTTTADPGAAPEEGAGDETGELIEVTGAAPVAPGTISLEGAVARDAPGALGEPLRALALLPGVTTSIAASGYPIVRGSLPGESRFTFDGIEIPMLYHMLIGNQTIHPSFVGNLELHAGGHGAEHGHLLGGLIAITPAEQERDRTELRANLVEAGAFVSRRLGPATSLAAAVRAGTLSGAAKIYNSGAALYTVDQQTRLVHRLGNGDQLTLTSLGAFDHGSPKPEPHAEILRLGFHRLDGRWTRAREGWRLRAGAQSEFDTLQRVFIPVAGGQPGAEEPVRRSEGGRSYGARAYADGSVRLARWLTARGGIAARYRTLTGDKFPLSLGDRADPFLGLARAVDSEGAWSELRLEVGRFEIVPGVRADSFRAKMPELSVRHANIDPRLAIAAKLPGGARAELAMGAYAAPPQMSVIESSVMMGPLPITDGAAASAGLSHGRQIQASLQVPLGADLRGDFAAYYRDTHYAVDFALADASFDSIEDCFSLTQAYLYREIDVRAFGAEALVRGDLGRSVSGWVSYSLGKIDRKLPLGTLPHDFDQRHTLNATAQWRRGKWRFGASALVRTGRPLMYPQPRICLFDFGPPGSGSFEISKDPMHLRRTPPQWRADLRAERRFQFSGWSMTGYVEIQNASFSKEITRYDIVDVDYEARTGKIVEHAVFLPLPMIGVEAQL